MIKHPSVYSRISYHAQKEMSIFHPRQGDFSPLSLFFPRCARALTASGSFAILAEYKFIHAFQYPSGFEGKQVKFLCTANAVIEESASQCHWGTPWEGDAGDDA